MHKRMPLDEKQEMVRRYKDGESSEEIARIMGRTGAGVRKALREFGIELRSAVYTEEIKREVVAMCDTHTIVDVAAHFGMSTTTVSRILRKAGVSLFVGRKIS